VGRVWGDFRRYAAQRDHGFVQNQKPRAIAALAESVTTEATVIHGQKVSIPPRTGAGDLVLLASGDKVPADLRLVKVRNRKSVSQP